MSDEAKAHVEYECCRSACDQDERKPEDCELYVNAEGEARETQKHLMEMEREFDGVDLCETCDRQLCLHIPADEAREFLTKVFNSTRRHLYDDPDFESIGNTAYNLLATLPEK